MRIALFSETYLPQRNGVAVILDRLIRYLAETGHDVFLAVPRAGRDEARLETPPGVELMQVPSVPLPRYPDLTVAAPVSRRVEHAVRAFRPDVVHLVTEYSMGLVGLRCSRKLGVPAVASFHTNIPNCLPYYGVGWLRRPCWRYLRWFHGHATFTFCPSAVTGAQLRDRGFKNVRVWGHGVDVDQFSPERRRDHTRRRHGPAEAIHLLYVGRLTPEKDLPILFDAYRHLSALPLAQPVHLVLTGDGAYSPHARSLAPEGVTFTGYLERERLSETYASADVFVFPSRVETQGNVVLEALASGLPVVGAAEGGVLENVRDRVNGLLCEPGDAQAFARGIRQLIEQPALRSQLGRNARSWAEERRWEATMAPLLAGYEEATTC